MSIHTAIRKLLGFSCSFYTVPKAQSLNDSKTGGWKGLIDIQQVKKARMRIHESPFLGSRVLQNAPVDAPGSLGLLV